MPAAFLEPVRTVTSSSLKALAPALRSDRLRALLSISTRLNSFQANFALFPLPLRVDVDTTRDLLNDVGRSVGQFVFVFELLLLLRSGGGRWWGSRRTFLSVQSYFFHMALDIKLPEMALQTVADKRKREKERKKRQGTAAWCGGARPTATAKMKREEEEEKSSFFLFFLSRCPSPQ